MKCDPNMNSTDLPTEQQRENLRKILLIARKHTARHKREASVEDAILIANREAQHEQFFKEKGVELP